MATIRFIHVGKRYEDDFDALTGVNFCINAGEMVFLTGQSGAGKSTLLKLIMLMERPTRGKIIIGDNDLGQLSKRQIPYYRRQIGVVHQNHQLLADRSVFDNVLLPLQIAGFDPADAARRARAALDKVGLLHKEHDHPISLSTGEQQRIGIARAIVHKPKLLLADEPTGNLDPQLSEDVMRLFAQFNQIGTTVLVASHDLRLIEHMRRRTLVLRKGRIIADG